MFNNNNLLLSIALETYTILYNTWLQKLNVCAEGKSSVFKSYILIYL